MKILSAIGKGIARHVNDKHAETQRKKANPKAYKKTGKDMKEANKKGYYLDGSTAYKRNLKAENKKISNKHKRREYFINDL